jgi:hypothetical protein
MFYTLLIVTFGVALAVSFLTASLFTRPADAILKRVIQDDIYRSWLTYLKFALYVVGISSGVRVNELERFITAPEYGPNPTVLDLTAPRWILEIYRTIIGTLQGLAWVLLIFFVVALIAFVLVRISETWRKSRTGQSADAVAP